MMFVSTLDYFKTRFCVWSQCGKPNHNNQNHQRLKTRSLVRTVLARTSAVFKVFTLFFIIDMLAYNIIFSHKLFRIVQPQLKVESLHLQFYDSEANNCWYDQKLKNNFILLPFCIEHPHHWIWKDYNAKMFVIYLNSLSENMRFWYKGRVDSKCQTNIASPVWLSCNVSVMSR